MKGDGVRLRHGAWHMRITFANGERREVTSTKKTKREAVRERAEILLKEDATRKRRKLGLEVDANYTFKDMYDRLKKISGRRRGWPSFESRLRIHLLPKFGKTPLAHISPADVERFLAEKAEQGLSPRTREHLRVTGSTIFNHATKKERVYRGDNPFALAERVGVQKKEPNILPAHFVHDVIEAVPERWRNFFALAVYTGLRSGELRALTARNIDPAQRWLIVTKSGDSATTKTNKSRPVPIPAAALPYLRDALKQSEGLPWVFVDTRGKQLTTSIKAPEILRMALDKLGLVSTVTQWCRKKACHFRERGLKQIVRTECPKCGRKLAVLPEHEMVFHDLRKTWETNMHELGGDPLNVSRMAGHALEVANAHYLGSNRQRMELLADSMDFQKLAPQKPYAGVKVRESVTELIKTREAVCEEIGEDTECVIDQNRTTLDS